MYVNKRALSPFRARIEGRWEGDTVRQFVFIFLSGTAERCLGDSLFRQNRMERP